MMTPQVLFFIIKLIVYGFVTFLSIFLMSKIRDSAWMSIICGFLCTYAEIVFEMLVELGVFTKGKVLFHGIPVIDLIFLVVPALFFTAGFVIMLLRKD